MSLPSRILERRLRRETLESFTLRVRPLVEAGLAGSVHEIPRGLGPVTGVVGRALGVDGRAGRRWRPLLTLAAAEAAGGRAEDAVDAAVAVELTHTASLVLDDMPCMDDSPLRRGEPAAHALVGSAGAILVAVGLLGRAAELLGRSGISGGALSEEWGRTFGFAGMSGGQAVDLMAGGDARGALRRLYRRKTTALSALAVEAGGAVAGAGPSTLSVFRGFGTDLGWAYQLVDDAQDRAEDDALGRAPGGRNPLRQAQRLLDRGTARIARLDTLAPGGAELLEALARDVVRIPPLNPVSSSQEGHRC